MPTKPGVGQEPASYDFAIDEFLQSNGNVQKMPKNERAWNAFIQELSRWIKNENGFWTPSFSGFSADPSSPICIWHRWGQAVDLKFVFTTGTSDATGFSITNIPEVIRPSSTIYIPMSGLHDNGSALTGAGSVQIDSAGACSFYSDCNFGTWTAGATAKGFTDGANNPSSITYLLRAPNKR